MVMSMVTMSSNCDPCAARFHQGTSAVATKVRRRVPALAAPVPEPARLRILVSRPSMQRALSIGGTGSGAPVEEQRYPTACEGRVANSLGDQLRVVETAKFESGLVFGTARSIGCTFCHASSTACCAAVARFGVDTPRSRGRWIRQQAVVVIDALVQI